MLQIEESELIRQAVAGRAQAFAALVDRYRGPLCGMAYSYLGSFDDSCHATRARKSSLVVPGGLPITTQVTGDALTVLHTVVSDWQPT